MTKDSIQVTDSDAEQVAGTGSHLAAKEQPQSRISTASPEIQELYLKATDGCLGLEENNSYLVSGFTRNAIVTYRLLGLSYDEIDVKIRTAVEKVLECGVEKGYEDGVEISALLEDQRTERTPTEQIRTAQAELPQAMNYLDFYQAYNIEEYQRINRDAEISPAYSKRGDAGDYLAMRDCLVLSEKSNAPDLVKRCVVQLLRMGDFDGLIDLADREGMDSTLIDMAHLFLADFYDHRSGHFYTNYVWKAIDCLQRVQGDQKSFVNKMLSDLADVLSSFDLAYAIETTGDPDLWNSTRRHLYSYAFWALRQTGEQVATAKIDSVKIDFATRVTDPDIIQKVENLWGKVQEEFPGYNEPFALACLVACGIHAPLYEQAEQALTKIGPVEFEPYRSAMEIYAGIGDRDKFEETLEQCKEDGVLARLESFLYDLIPLYQGVLEQGIQTYPIRYMDDTYTPMEERYPNSDQVALDIMLKNEARIAADMDATLRTLSPEDRRDRIAKGYDFLERDRSWHAHVSFRDAAYKPGLIRAAKALLQDGNAINAFKPLNCAVVLPDESESLEGEALPSLPRN